MTQLQIDFDKQFRSRGGLLKYHDLPFQERKHFENSKSLFASMINYMKAHYPNMPNIYSDFIANDMLNAGATNIKGNYIIGINVGTMNLIADLFNKVFANKNLLTNVGHPESELYDELKLSALGSANSISFDFSQKHIVPKDVVRKAYSEMYNTMALQFLFNHELGHILRGHVDLVNQLKTANNFLDEINYSQTSVTITDTLLYQTLEMDADSFATNHAFLHAMSLIVYPENKVILPNEVLPVFENIEGFFENWIFVLYSLFKLFGINQFDEKSEEKNSHPSPSTRINMILPNFMSILEFHNLKTDFLVDVFAKQVVEAEKVFSDITFQEANPEIIRQSYLDSNEYKMKVVRNWNNVRPLLEPFAFGNLPPLRPLN